MGNGIKEKDFSNNLNLIAKSSIIVFAGVIFSKIFSYIYKIIIARNFGPEGYGLFTIAVMVTGWFITISGLGLNQGLVRFIPILKSQNKFDIIKEFIQGSFSKVLISSLAGFFILFFSAEFIAIKIFHEPQLIIFLKFFSISVPLTVLMEIFLSVIQANEKIFVYNFIYKFFIGLSKLVLLLLFISLGLKISAIYFSYLIGISVTFFLTFIFFTRIYPGMLSGQSKDISKSTSKQFSELLTYSWPLVFYAVVWNIFYWTDTLLIGYFKGTADAGIYNAAEPIVFLLNFAPQIFLQLFFPLINREYSKGKKEMVKQLSKQVGKWIFAINLFVFAVILMFPESIINILFGAKFLAAKNSLRILAVGAMFYSIFRVSDNLIAMRGRSKVILFDLLGVFIFNLVGNIFLIPPYGLVGASISTSLSLVILSLILARQAYKSMSIIPLRRKMLNLSFAILIASVICS